MSRPKDFTRRTRERRRAVDVLYEVDQRGRVSSRSIAAMAERRTSEHATQTGLPDYARQIVEGVADHLAHIDYALSQYAHGWTLDRMPAVDRAILRVGVWEILYESDVSDPVAIDEAVKIAKLLSTDKSPGFINGLLDTIASVKAGLIAQEAELSAPVDDYEPAFDEADFAGDVDFADEVYSDAEYGADDLDEYGYEAALDDGEPLGEEVADREEVAPESGEFDDVLDDSDETVDSLDAGDEPEAAPMAGAEDEPEQDDEAEDEADVPLEGDYASTQSRLTSAADGDQPTLFDDLDGK